MRICVNAGAAIPESRLWSTVALFGLAPKSLLPIQIRSLPESNQPVTVREAM